MSKLGANYSGALLNSRIRDSLYQKNKDGCYVFENPLYSDDALPTPAGSSSRRVSVFQTASSMRLKDFLASIPSFSDFTDEQLLSLESKATIKNFESGDIIFKQGEDGDAFFVIHQGAVDVCIQENPSLLKKEKPDLGKVVNRLKDGCYFGERALMTAELRAASIKVITDTVCLVFSRAVFEEIMSSSDALIGKSTDEGVDL